MSKIQMYDYEVTFMRVETSQGYVEASTEEEAKAKLQEEAERQALVGFKIRKLTPFEVPDVFVKEDDEDMGEKVVKLVPKNTLN